MTEKRNAVAGLNPAAGRKVENETSEIIGGCISVFAPDEGSQVLNIVLHAAFVVSVIYCIYLAKRVETPAIHRVESASGPQNS